MALVTRTAVRGRHVWIDLDDPIPDQPPDNPEALRPNTALYPSESLYPRG